VGLTVTVVRMSVAEIFATGLIGRVFGRLARFLPGQGSERRPGAVPTGIAVTHNTDEVAGVFGGTGHGSMVSARYSDGRNNNSN
jgi:hypothetical protein